MEQIEEWNEFGELGMEIESFDDFSGLSFASEPPAPVTLPPKTTTTAPDDENAPPRQSTIKIQSPPSKIAGKGDHINLTLRQASQEAASKAKENARTKLGLASAPESKESNKEMGGSAAEGIDPTRTATTTSTTTPTIKSHEEGQSESPSGSGRRASQIKRPDIPTEVAVQSTDDFHADSAQALGVMEHHRSDSVSATSPGEQAKIASDIRKSISEDRDSAVNGVEGESSDKKLQENAKQEDTKPEDTKQDTEQEEAKGLRDSGSEKPDKKIEEITGKTDSGEHGPTSEEQSAQKEKPKRETKDDNSSVDG